MLNGNIPPKNRKEWELLVTAKIDHQFKNYVLQVKSSEYSKKIEAGELKINQAIDELYALCEKYALAVQSDFKKIFNEW